MLETFVVSPASGEGGAEALKPEIRVLESNSTYAKVALEPLQQGYGITVGNPLRRILLSSIKGSAISWVKIEGVVHEYDTVKGVKEEVMDLLLNIKRIRIRSSSGRTGKMRLDVRGAGRVCAGDIATSADFEIVNPELPLATLDAEDSNLSIEFNVEPGVGYQVAGQSEASSGLPVGVLPVDAIFSPVRKVNYSVERTRVGQVTDYERLLLDVWTDGAITPLDAIRDAAEILVNHFFLFSNLNRNSEVGLERPALMISPEVYQMPIEKLELSPRTLNCLKRAHITKVGEVLEMSDDQLLHIRNFGEKSLDELKERLVEMGISPHAKPSQSGREMAELSPGGASRQAVDLSAEDMRGLMGDKPVVDPAAPQGNYEDDEDWVDSKDEEDSK